MHDLAFFRANLDSIAQRLATRGYQLEVEQFRALDAERRAALTEAEQLKAQVNTKSAEVAKLRKAGQDTNGHPARSARHRRARFGAGSKSESRGRCVPRI